MRLASAERDNERLRTEIAQLHSELGRYDDIIIGAIAPRSDALHRQRALADGIICGCCALRRLPDSFFPAVLAVGTPPARRRCVFCMQATREQYDVYGRPFFIPRGFTFVPPTDADLYCLSHDLRRCPSCASMRHRDLFRNFPGAEVFVSLHPTAAHMIRSRFPSDSPRVALPAGWRICLFCRRTQAYARAEREAAEGRAAASALGADAMETDSADVAPSPLAAMPRDARDVLQWAPDAGCLADSDLDDDDDRLGPCDLSESYGV